MIRLDTAENTSFLGCDSTKIEKRRTHHGKTPKLRPGKATGTRVGRGRGEGIYIICVCGSGVVENSSEQQAERYLPRT